MLHKYAAILSLLLCTLQPQVCCGQTSQELNNKGCDALVKHDYAAAENLFLAAYDQARTASDYKRMHTALGNLEELYSSQGLEQKATRIKTLNSRLQQQRTAPIVSPQPDANSAYEAALERIRDGQRQRQAQQERQARNYEMDQQIQQMDQQRRADEQRAASMQSDAYSTEHESMGRLRSSSGQADFVRARITSQH